MIYIYIYIYIYCIYIYCIDIYCIYIYIYIVIHRQTVSFYRNSSVWLDTQDAQSRDRDPSNFTLDKFQTTRSPSGPRWLREFLRYLFSNSSSSLCLHFYTLSATRVLNSFEELCITLAAADNSFARVLNPHGGAYIYIYIYIYKSHYQNMVNFAGWFGHLDTGL